MISYIRELHQAKVICKQDPQTYIWAEKGLHNEEIHCLYHLYNTGRVIKSTNLRFAEQPPRMEEGMRSFKILTEKEISRKAKA
jgi:hypothetical protein